MHHRGAVAYLHDSRPGHPYLNTLVLPHQDGRHDLTGFGAVQEGVLQRHQVGSWKASAQRWKDTLSHVDHSGSHVQKRTAWGTFQCGNLLFTPMGVEQYVMPYTL